MIMETTRRNALRQLSQTNPLRGLDHSRLIYLLERGEEGYYSDLQWLYRMIEKRDPVVRAVKRRIMSSLGKLDWDVKIVDQEQREVASGGFDQQLAEEQRGALREAYDRVENLSAALAFFSASAELRGFAHLEKIYAPGSWDIVELRPVEQWFWCRDGLYAPWRYNRDARSFNRGVPVDMEQFVVREVDDPADEIFAIYYLRKTMSEKDWDGFLERYGIPSPFIEGPPDVPPGKEEEYRETAEAIAADGGGYLPNGSEVHFAAPPAGSTGVFRERLEYLDGQIVIAGTSGKLTILNEATGIGGGQAEVHDGVFDDIAQAVAMQASGALQRQFDKPILARLFPDAPVLAYFEYAKVDEEDTSAHINNAKTLGEAGYEIELDELSEKTGYKIVRKASEGGDKANATPLAETSDPASAPDALQNSGDPLQNGFPAAAGSRQPTAPQNPVASESRDRLARAAQALAAPARDAAAPLLEIAAREDASVEELATAVEELIDRLPDLLDETNAALAAGELIAALGIEPETRPA